MDTIRTLPPVGDPVEAEVEDLVIEEARRRARRRHWRYGGAVAVLLGLVVAACVPLYAGSGSGKTPVVADLPSTPVAGATDVLVTEIPSEHVRTWVFADGRLITMRMHGTFDATGWPNTGFLEQRLTPAGVEMIRSWVTANAGLLIEETRPANERGRDVRVLVGDKLYHRYRTNVNEYWRCHWADCEEYLANLTNELPESAWADKEYRTYVPSEYRICAYAGRDGQDAPIEMVRAALPAEVRELFTPGAARPSGWGCVQVDPDTARTVEASALAAGFRRSQHTVRQYEFTLPATAETEEFYGIVMVGAVLPNGDAEEPAG